MRPEELQSAIKDLGRDLAERKDILRLAVLAVLSGEHILLLGPPGTAKSLIARRVCSVFMGFRYFEYLLTRFTVPEEVFGPLSLKALQEDRFLRKTAGYLPEAHVAFLDETFKANSAILNALLTLINERVFHNGSERVNVPLRTIIGASNEVPGEGEGLDALYDRFLLRVVVEPVHSDTEFLNKIVREPETPEIRNITPDFLEWIDRQWTGVELDSQVEEGILRLRARLRDLDVYVSDRRWKAAIKVLKVAALASGRSVVDRFDALLLQHMVWSSPEQRSDVFRIVRSTFLGELEGDTRAEEVAKLSAKLVDLRDEISGVKAGRRGDCPNVRVCKNYVADQDALGKCANFIPDSQGGCVNYEGSTAQRRWFAPAMTMSMYAGGSSGDEPERWICRTQPCLKFKELITEIEALVYEIEQDALTLRATINDQGKKLLHIFSEVKSEDEARARSYQMEAELQAAVALREKARRLYFQLFGEQ